MSQRALPTHRPDPAEPVRTDASTSPATPTPEPAKKTPGRPRLQRRLGNQAIQQLARGPASQQLHSLLGRSTGHPLEGGLRRTVESHAGLDLGSAQVHDDPSSHVAAAALGAHAFTRGSAIYLGATVGTSLGPSRQAVLRHETLHLAQMQKGRLTRRRATRSKVESQAHAFAAFGHFGHGHLEPADPDATYGWVWVIPVAGAALYTLLRPNVANAPSEEDVRQGRLQPSVSPLQVGAEAMALFALPELIFGRSLVAGATAKELLRSSAVAGGSSAVAYQGVQDVGAGRFSGVDTYAAQAAGGSLLGLTAGVPLIGYTRGWSGPALYGSFAGSGMAAGVTMRGMGDLHQGQMSSLEEYLMWGGGGALLMLGGAGAVRTGDYFATRGLVASDLLRSEQLAAMAQARGGLTASEVQAALARSRPDLAGRLSEGYLSSRNLEVLYRGQGQTTASILSPAARAGGVDASMQLYQTLERAGLSPEEIAGLTSRWGGQPVPVFDLVEHGLPVELANTTAGGAGIPVSRIPGVGAKFAGHEARYLQTLGQTSEPTIYILRVPRDSATSAARYGLGGAGGQAAAETERVIFNQVPRQQVVGQASTQGVTPLRATQRVGAGSDGSDVWLLVIDRRLVSPPAGGSGVGGSGARGPGAVGQ